MQLLKDAPPALATDIQQKLIKLGLLEPPADGEVGPLTLRGWAQFKRAHHQNNLDAYGEGSLKLLEEASEVAARPLVSIDQLTLGFGRRPSEEQYQDLLRCINQFEINTPRRLCHFLAQVGHESGGLKYSKEIASGAAYEGRKDLGNTQPGDGKKYKGASAIQLTGRANYLAFSKAVNDPLVMQGVDYVASNYFFTAAGWFWSTRKLNKLADQGASVAAITKIVNGGQRGLADRVAYYNRFKAILT